MCAPYTRKVLHFKFDRAQQMPPDVRTKGALRVGQNRSLLVEI
jgi:hypothetical protein